jgi:hypothetical protein
MATSTIQSGEQLLCGAPVVVILGVLVGVVASSTDDVVHLRCGKWWTHEGFVGQTQALRAWSIRQQVAAGAIPAGVFVVFLSPTGDPW